MNMYSTCQSLNCIQAIEKKKNRYLNKRKNKGNVCCIFISLHHFLMFSPFSGAAVFWWCTLKINTLSCTTHGNKACRLILYSDDWDVWIWLVVSAKMPWDHCKGLSASPPCYDNIYPLAWWWNYPEKWLRIDLRLSTRLHKVVPFYQALHSFPKSEKEKNEGLGCKHRV